MLKIIVPSPAKLGSRIRLRSSTPQLVGCVHSVRFKAGYHVLDERIVQQRASLIVSPGTRVFDIEAIASQILAQP